MDTYNNYDQLIVIWECDVIDGSRWKSITN